jgi:UDP-N-acetylmuramate--alanine ligase
MLGDRRFAQGTAIVVDDYGHHPREVAVTQQAIKAAYPNSRLITVFQPHRYTRTKNLFEDFVQVLAETDVLIMLEVYGAGEERIPSADARSLCHSIRQRGKVDPIFVSDQDELTEILHTISQEGDVILMQGAGNIGALAQTIADSLADN